MRSFSHLTFGYVKNRIAQRVYQSRFPDHPWLTRGINNFLNEWLCASDVGFEYGSGRSTLWIAQRVGYLTSIEEDESWRNRIQDGIMERRLNEKVDLKGIYYKQNGDRGSYINSIENHQDQSLDFCLVDGSFRDLCALAALPKLKLGGILIVDDVERYIPRAEASQAPEARAIGQGFQSEAWSDFFQIVSKWRCFWTSDGVSDTAIWFKPYADC